jgi:ParB/RepB/Spo0J family partition protein
MGIPIKNIVRSPFNVRKEYIPETVEDLARNIEEEGLISRIVVRSVGEGNYEVLAGGRRTAALRMLYGEDYEVPEKDLIFKDDISDFEALHISLSENVHRISFSSMELANAAEKAKQLRPAISTKDIAKMFWTSDARIKRLFHVIEDLDKIPTSVREEMETPDEDEPAFTDAHWEALRKSGIDELSEDKVRDICDYIIEKEVKPSKVGDVIKRFEDVEVTSSDPNDPESSSSASGSMPGEEDPFEEKFNGELRLVEEDDGKLVLYVAGKKEDKVIEWKQFAEYLKNSDKFKVYLNAKIKIKPLEL